MNDVDVDDNVEVVVWLLGVVNDVCVRATLLSDFIMAWLI